MDPGRGAGRGRCRAGPVLSRYVRPLTEPDPTLAEVGGKAWSLARLAAAGLPVPPGFVVTTAAYDRFVAEQGREALDRAGATLPEALAGPIRTAYRALGSVAVAVRSSATAEDLPELSFAGQQATFLNVRGEDQLLDAVRRCWSSLWTERAVAYRRREQVADAGLSLAVLVQELVVADAAGVMFTVDPVTGADDVLVVDAAWGLGEAVVGGLVSADTFRLSRPGGAVLGREIHRKQMMTVLTDTGTTETAVPDRRQREPSLTDPQLRELARLGEAVADLAGTAVDIEWCLSAGWVHLLQSRPVTTRPSGDLQGPDGRGPDLWNDSRDGDFLWTNTNVGEAIPDVMTPATWSMVQVFLGDSMATASIPPYLGYGRIGGRIYLNVSVMKTLSGAVGVNERHYRALTEEVFGRIPSEVEIPPVRVSRLAVLRGVLPMGLHVLREARRDVALLADYLDDHPRRCAERMADVRRVGSGPELAALWSGTLEAEFHRVSWMLSAATRVSGASFVLTRQRLQRLVGDAAANALTAGLGATAGELASLGLLEGLDRLAEGEIDRATFDVRYGHRGPHEFEISLPRPGEDPHWVDAQLAGRARATTSYRVRLARQQEEREKAGRELTARHPVQARLLGRQLRIWARISRDRERARSEVIRYFWVLRAYTLRAGELTGLGERIFFCSGEEIVRALNGETVRPIRLAERQAAYAGYCRLPAYPGLIRGRFDPYTWAADPDRRTDVFVAGRLDPGARSGSGPVRGFPGSAGVVVGRVRRLVDAADGDQLQAGEVLVTTVTNVGWTPLFPRVAAVVTDVGAPLSHAAIVAREIGIPAVVGCGDATMRLRTGDLVRVDGAAGTVELLTGGADR